MKLRFTMAYVFATLLSGSTHAGLIQGTHTTANGSTVALQGLEWMPLTYTSGLSRTAIEAGFTDHFGNTWAASEWRYASRQETETLIHSLWGKTADGWSNNNSAGAWWFLDNFGALAFDTGVGLARQNISRNDSTYSAYDYSDFFFGQSGDCGSQSCYGSIAALNNYKGNINARAVDGSTITYVANSGAAGGIGDLYGLAFPLDNGNAMIANNTMSTNMGSLLVRTVATPPPVRIAEPSTWGLFAITVASFALRRRTRVKN